MERINLLFIGDELCNNGVFEELKRLEGCSNLKISRLEVKEVGEIPITFSVTIDFIKEIFLPLLVLYLHDKLKKAKDNPSVLSRRKSITITKKDTKEGVEQKLEIIVEESQKTE